MTRPREPANLRKVFVNDIIVYNLIFIVVKLIWIDKRSFVFENLEIIAVAMVVLQRLVINDVNDRHHKCLGILLDSAKQLEIYKDL